MEYVHGEDLRKLLKHTARRKQKLPFEHIITIVSNVAAALHYAHEHKTADRKPLGLVHRDVSPANILVAYDGNVKVVDFGIAKATQRTTETHSGLMKGKVAYMSPEQCLGQPVDRRSDIFCLGIVLYELVTIRRLFKGANDFLTMSSITHGTIPKPSQFRPDLPPELEAIILKALAPAPAKRYQTADELRTALERFAVNAKIRTSTTALADYMCAEFGERPVPWLADDDEPEVELTYDFDGSASGIVVAPTGFDLPVAFVPHSPIVKARTKAITDAPPMAPLADQSGTLPPQAAPPRAAASTTTAPPVGARSRRVLYAALGGVVGVAAIIVIVVSSMRSSDAEPPATPSLPPPAARTVPREPEPITPPNLVGSNEPAPAATVKPTEPEPVVVKPKVKPVKPVKKPPARGSWDPNTLFPKKP
jgi:serine/threonine-protein kinase